MEWNLVLQDKNLANLPYKIELNEYGQILMSPASNHHGLLQVEIAFFLRANTHGKVLTECSINTQQGVKVADVAWASEDFFLIHNITTPYPNAPEICVEIISPSNSKAEMEAKIGLYLAQGAHEVWVCKQNGSLIIHASTGVQSQSKFFKTVPKKFEY